MPIQLIQNPGAAFGLPLTSASGVNDQGALIEVINNSGTWLRYGDVVVWDNNAALSTVATLTISGDQTASVTSFTLTASGSTASYASSGALLVNATITGTADAPVPLFISYTGLSGSTFTGAKAHIASITNGLDSGDTLYQWPQSFTLAAGSIAGSYAQSVVALAAAPLDGGRYVTLSSTGAVNDPNVAGVISPGHAGTTVGSPPQTNFPNAAIAPGAACFIATTGVARVQINGVTVSAGNALGTGVAPGGASAGTPTLGNLVGIALEANTAKDANNTIRVALKIG